MEADEIINFIDQGKEVNPNEGKSYSDKFFSRFKSNSNSPRISPKGFLGGMLIMVLAVSSVLLSQRVLNPVGKPNRSSASGIVVPWSYPRQMNVLIVRYFDPSSQPQFRDPASAKTMSDFFQGYIRGASIAHGNVYNIPSVTVNVLGTYDYNEAPPGPSVYWEDAFNQILSRQLPAPEAAGQNLCAKIVANKIDQVWFMADPTIGHLFKGPEFAISSKFIRPGSVPTSFDAQIIPANLFCGGQRSFGIMYLDLSRGTTASLHSFGHYMESLIGDVQGYDLFYKKYMGVGYSTQNNNGAAIDGGDLPSSCGSVHAPPNASLVPGTSPQEYQGYQYDSTTQVMSSCPNWSPDGTGAKVPVSTATWSNGQAVAGTTENRYMMWWMQNMPNAGNTLTYAGVPLPNWWDFVVDLDGTISYYLSTPAFMNPQLLSLASTTTSASAASGTSTAWTAPPADQVLGASTTSESKGEVLQAATGTYTNMAIVTAAYRAHTNPTAAVSSISYCGVSMFRIAGSVGRVKHQDQTSEMWYLLNPPAGNCQITASFTADPEDRILTATVFNNVASSNFIESYLVGGYDYPPGSTSYTYTKASEKDTMSVCTYSNYPNGGNNKVNPIGLKWRQLYNSGYISKIPNIQSALGASYERTSDNETMQLQWLGTQSYPWATFCVNLRVKPQSGNGGGSTPAPLPTPNIPPPTLDLKVNGSNGPLNLKYGTAMTINWATTNVNSCIGSASFGTDWSGTKAANGSSALASFQGTKTYTLACIGNNGQQVTDSVTVSMVATSLVERTYVDLKVNGSDGPVTVTNGQSVKVDWFVSSNTISCEVNGKGIADWSGPRAAGGTDQVTVKGATGGVLTVICKTPWGLTRDHVALVIGSYQSALPPGLSAPTAGISGKNFPGVLLTAYETDGPVTTFATGDLRLKWTPYGASFTSCTASGSWTGAKAAGGGEEVLQSLTAGNKTYTLTCKLGTSSVVTSVYVNVENPNAVLPAAIQDGQVGWMERMYADKAFGSLKKTSSVSFINYDWGTAAPDASMPADNYSVRWTGQFVPWKTGSYTFNATVDNGVRLLFGSTYVLNSWSNAARRNVTGKINLVAGRPYNATINYFENTGPAAFILNILYGTDPADVYIISSDNGL